MKNNHIKKQVKKLAKQKSMKIYMSFMGENGF